MARPRIIGIGAYPGTDIIAAMDMRSLFLYRCLGLSFLLVFSCLPMTQDAKSGAISGRVTD